MGGGGRSKREDTSWVGFTSLTIYCKPNASFSDQGWLESLANMEATVSSSAKSQKNVPDSETIERTKQFFQSLAAKDGRKDRALLLKKRARYI